MTRRPWPIIVPKSSSAWNQTSKRDRRLVVSRSKRESRWKTAAMRTGGSIQVDRNLRGTKRTTGRPAVLMASRRGRMRGTHLGDLPWECLAAFPSMHAGQVLYFRRQLATNPLATPIPRSKGRCREASINSWPCIRGQNSPRTSLGIMLRSR